jgi:hypothetical protein
MDEKLLWAIRAFVYRHFAETSHPPLVAYTATEFGLTSKEAAFAYEELHKRHAFFLKPKTLAILMANPFSGVETSFKVHTDHKTYFANCAWDSLGIPASLHVDAEVEAACAQSGKPIRLTVRGQQVEGTEVLVHFLVPFKDWYNDLSFT